MLDDQHCRVLEEFRSLLSIEMRKLNFTLVSKATRAEFCSLLGLVGDEPCSNIDVVLNRLEAEGESLYAKVIGELLVYVWVPVCGVSSESFSYHFELSVTHLEVLRLYFELLQSEFDPFRIIWQAGLSEQYYPRDAWKNCLRPDLVGFPGTYITVDSWNMYGPQIIGVHIQFLEHYFIPAMLNNSSAEGLLLLKQPLLTSGSHFVNNLAGASIENSSRMVPLSNGNVPDLTGRLSGLDVVLAYKAGRTGLARLALNDLKRHKQIGVPGYLESDLYVQNATRLLDGVHNGC
ncbi:MAG: hypothetical protein HY986_26015 [Candidatus Melainabacteria bacterium]|nr:hypothetical protein [Candidatus Melainabacteria bacterium]